MWLLDYLVVWYLRRCPERRVHVGRHGHGYYAALSADADSSVLHLCPKGHQWVGPSGTCWMCKL